jgi:cytoskeleton protein RodZ
MDRQLQLGDSYLVPNMVGVTLSSPDSGALELILDGASMGYAGKDGVPSDGLSLNPQDIVDRQGHG